MNIKFNICLGVGLGGLIILNLLEKQNYLLRVSCYFAMLELKRDYKGRKNKLISNVGKISKDTRFKVGITPQDLTRNDEIIEETTNDGLMLKKVTYSWYNLINEKMKETMDHIRDIKPISALIMYGTNDKILETQSINEMKDKLKSKEMYFKVWDGLYHEIHNEPERDLVMRYVLSFLNNSVNTMGFIVNEEEIERHLSERKKNDINSYTIL